MKLLEKTALNEILKTVAYVAEQVKVLNEKVDKLSQEDVKENASSTSKSAATK